MGGSAENYVYESDDPDDQLYGDVEARLHVRLSPDTRMYAALFRPKADEKSPLLTTVYVGWTTSVALVAAPAELERLHTLLGRVLARDDVRHAHVTDPQHEGDR